MMIIGDDNNNVFNIGQLVIPYSAVPATMNLFGFNFQIEL